MYLFLHVEFCPIRLSEYQRFCAPLVPVHPLGVSIQVRWTERIQMCGLHTCISGTVDHWRL